MRKPRHMRPQRERHHQAQCRKGEAVRASERLGGFRALATRRGGAGFID